MALKQEWSKAMKLIITVLIAFIITGCGSGEYIPSKTFQIKTVDGQILKLNCPTVDLGRSKLTYVIDNECRLIK